MYSPIPDPQETVAHVYECVCLCVCVCAHMCLLMHYDDRCQKQQIGLKETLQNTHHKCWKQHGYMVDKSVRCAVCRTVCS